MNDISLVASKFQIIIFQIYPLQILIFRVRIWVRFKIRIKVWVWIRFRVRAGMILGLRRGSLHQYSGGVRSEIFRKESIIVFGENKKRSSP